MRVAALLVLVLLVACGSDPSPVTDADATTAAPTLENLIEVSDGVWSGGDPVGDEDFGALAELGVMTVISVDAADPDVARAEALGMRYVHLPLGYGHVGGIDKLRLTRAVRDLPRPIYIHCHHGLHRGPTAAALALVCTGELSNTDALAFMEEAGTSPTYAGLWHSVEEAAVIDPSAIDAVRDEDLVPVARVEGMGPVMAEMDRIYVRLTRMRHEGWATPTWSPDLVPEAEAGRMADLFRALTETGELDDESDEFRRWMREAGQQAADLEQALVNGDSVLATTSFDALDASCIKCHDAYRY